MFKNFDNSENKGSELRKQQQISKVPAKFKTTYQHCYPHNGILLNIFENHWKIYWRNAISAW